MSDRKVGSILHALTRQDVSLPLSKLRPLQVTRKRADHPVKLLPHRHPPRALGHFADLLLQAPAPAPLAATLGQNFDGVGVPNYSVTGAPPDTNGAVGATQYVQWVNTAFAVFDKGGSRVYGPADGSTLWQGFGGPCETENSGDAIALYDKAANRWVLSQFAVETAPYSQCIAVSTTSDATGPYRRFAYSFGNDFNDYPKVGVWPDGYYITFNIFTGGQTFAGAKVCAFDRLRMLDPSATPGAMQCFQPGSQYGGLLPADLDGSTPPPSGSPNFVLAFDDASLSALNLWKFKVDWATPGASTFTGPLQIPVAGFTEACNGATCIAEPGGGQLDSLADRLMYRLAYRNFGTSDSLLVNHSVDVGGHSAVRWYEIKAPGGSPTVYQQGTYSPDSSHRWMGSMAMDQRGNILLGYSVSSDSLSPSIRYTGRLASDALGTLQTEGSLFAGSGSQTGGITRWGDYSAASLDPTDDCTIFYTNEYLKTTGSFNWSTRIGSFKFPTCSCP